MKKTTSISIIIWSLFITLLFGCQKEEEVPKTRIISISGNSDFGTVILGQTSSRNFTVRNNGTDILNISNISLPAGFEGYFNGTIPANSSRNITVTFRPTNSGIYYGNLFINANETSGVNSIQLNGQASASIIKLFGDLNFGKVEIGQSKNMTLQIQNTGTANLEIQNIKLPSGYTSNFSTTQFIAPNSVLTLTITFKPTSVGIYNSNVEVQSNATSGTNIITILGEGIQTNAIISVNNDLNFGELQVGQFVTKQIIIKNIGNIPLIISGISGISTPFTGSFSGTIAPNSSQTVNITFTPKYSGTYNSSCTINGNQASGNNVINFVAKAINPPRIEITGDLNFGSIAKGEKVTKQITVKNTGDMPLILNDIKGISRYTKPIATNLNSSTLTTTLQAGSSATIDIIFEPDANLSMTYNGNLEFVSNQIGGNNIISYSGKGVNPPRIELSVQEPNRGFGWEFGNVKIGTTLTKPLTIRNLGDLPLIVTGISINASTFSGNFIGTIQPGGSQIVDITFSPTGAFYYTYWITVVCNAKIGDNRIYANGSGVR
jgi:hypothetical protein